MVFIKNAKHAKSFALAAGLSGAVSSNAIILTAGLAEIVAGAISMGLGGYLAGKTETEIYQGELKREGWPWHVTGSHTTPKN
jgi:hypothetical protein